jgi:hypothetical protein
MSVCYDMLSRSPAAVPRRSHGPALEPRAPRLRAWLRPRPIRGSTRRCQALRRGAKGGIRAGAERRDACCSGRHLGRGLDVQLEKRGSSRLPDISARLTGECSWQTNIGNDVGVEPTTPRTMVLCSTSELVVMEEPVGPGPLLNAEHTCRKAVCASRDSTSPDPGRSAGARLVAQHFGRIKA